MDLPHSFSSREPSPVPPAPSQTGNRLLRNASSIANRTTPPVRLPIFLRPATAAIYSSKLRLLSGSILSTELETLAAPDLHELFARLIVRNSATDRASEGYGFAITRRNQCTSHGLSELDFRNLTDLRPGFMRALGQSFSTVAVGIVWPSPDRSQQRA